MLTKMTIKNFKRFTEVEIDLGNPVVFIGPNNSGKTTALQALALWSIGLRRWNEKRRGKTAPEKRPGVTINRRDLIAVPVPDANLLWRDLHVRDVQRDNGQQKTTNVRIDIKIEGVTQVTAWQCGLEFDYANEESFYCRPLRLSEEKNPARMPIPEETTQIRVAFLPPMSGLAANETRLDQGAINVRVGEGRTAEVLRNLCYQIVTAEEGQERWNDLREQIQHLFGVALDEPKYIAERGEISMSYCNPSGARLDLSSTGRGLQQTLLLLAHLAVNPGTILLLDEPDAHLELLRQRQIYQVLTDAARRQGSQIIAASHSEVILNEAADRDVVVAFLGRPHRIDDRGSQLLKSLKEIGYDQYYQAAQTGWVLYLEGSTDLAILRAFADLLSHPVKASLERPFVRYIENLPRRAREHFHGLREAKADLVGYTLCDKLTTALQSTSELQEYMWQRREIECYLCQIETLIAFAEQFGGYEPAGPLFEPTEQDRRRNIMNECIQDFVPGAAIRDPNDSWWHETKVTDAFLDRLFPAYFGKLNLPNLMNKTNYHALVRFLPRHLVVTEVQEVLDAIQRVAERAVPAKEI